MRTTLAKLLSILTVISLMDGQYMLMQTWAWAEMLTDRAPEQGIKVALETTFDGQHPCERCKLLAEKKQEKREQAPVPETRTAAKAALLLDATPVRPFPPGPSRLAFLLESDLPPPATDAPVITPPPEWV